jgi:hypothetical protein
MTIFRFDAIVNEFGDTIRVMSEAFGKLDRVLGYYKNEFIKAWELNTETQHLSVIYNTEFLQHRYYSHGHWYEDLLLLMGDTCFHCR